MSDLNVIDSDRQFAADILEDMGNFEEGITDLEKLAQWVRNVRHAAEKKVSAQPQSPWMPIETAPERGRYLISGKWLGEPHVNMADDRGHPATLWKNMSPTHWMPLPDGYPVTRPVREGQ